MAHYKTIALGLIQENPEMYERLRSTKRLLSAMDARALDLKAGHEAWKDQLDRANPGSDPAQTEAEALELAIEDLRCSLCVSEASDGEPLSLDAAMSYLRSHSQPA